MNRKFFVVLTVILAIVFFVSRDIFTTNNNNNNYEEITEHAVSAKILYEIQKAADNKDMSNILTHQNKLLHLSVFVPPPCKPYNGKAGRYPPFNDLMGLNGRTCFFDGAMGDMLTRDFMLFMDADTYSRWASLFEETSSEWACSSVVVRPKYISDFIWSGPIGNIVLMVDQKSTFEKDLIKCDKLRSDTIVESMKLNLIRFASLSTNWASKKEDERYAFLQKNILKVSDSCYKVSYQISLTNNLKNSFYTVTAKSELNGTMVTFSSNDIEILKNGVLVVTSFSVDDIVK